MWPVPSPSTPYLVAAINTSSFVDLNSFSKAGRKINVGDCALFKLPNGSPPSVGIIRKLTVDKEENLTLTVNLFFRPTEVKLSKGALLEAAPNEVFYSLHKDEIPATSLLHPCKVAFLRKGVNLPSGVSSFICRRVYDIENKCLFWLTDQNSIIQQEEVDKLLDKTQAEMHGGRSPKPLNSPNGTTQLKSSSDKSKKREHSVHSQDSVKREETDGSQQLKPEHVLKSELAKITDKGGLVDFEGVEKIIQLMQPESADKKVDLASRVILADVISVTDRFELLGRFVQRRGLLILDEWLQEVHKGKIGDGSPKGSDNKDKSVEEFLFALLRALDRLPVNLHALQTCNVGKSVNHLRSHKNSEIQKKARSLVDTWKKRVEAEMNIIETRSGARRGGSWPNKSMMPEVKVSPSQPSLRPQQKPNSSDAIVKSPESPSPTKPPPGTATATATSDAPLNTIKEEKSRSSSPNNSQSCSSDHGKTRDDAPTSTSGSKSGISHCRKSKEGVIGKFGSVNRNFTSGKGSPVRGTDASFSDNMNNNQRIIVRLPNTVRSPARTVSGGKVDTSSRVNNNRESDEVTEKLTTEVSASDVTLKQGKSFETSYSSVNALVESCAKFSEVNVSAPAGDDVGMNLLASVAAGEMSPVGSSENKPQVPEDTCSGNDTKLRQQNEDGCQSEEKVKVKVSEEKTGECNTQLENGNSVNTEPDVKPGDVDVTKGVVDQRGISTNTWRASEKAVENDVVLSDAGVSVKGETQNDESASWSSSEKHVDDKKLVRKQSSNSNVVLKKEETENKETGIVPDSSVLGNSSEQNIEEKTKSPMDVQENKADVAGVNSETAVKLDFDLNEVLPSDDIQSFQTPYQLPSTSNRPASVTVAAAAKGRFYPSESLLKGKAELGWKGSAATSAFRPAEPRKVVDVSVTENSTSKQARAFLDFDLNVGADDVSQNNVPSSGGLGLDLNACEDTPDVGPLSVTFSRPNTIQQIPPRSLLSTGFDLNGPGVEDSGGELPHSGNGIQFLSTVPNVRMNNMDIGNFHSWFPPSSTYPAIPIPAQSYPMVPGAPSQRMLTPVNSGSFNPEMFRGPVLSSSPAVAFPSTMPFQFPGFPFETNYAVNSNTYSGVSFPTIPSQLVGASGVVSSPYRPFMMSLPGGSSNIGPDGRRWGSHGLDLNAGPGGGGGDIGGGGGGGDEQLKVFQQMAAGGGGVLKRKEPEDGWDPERISYKHPSWQ